MKNSLRIHKWTHNEFNIFILGVLTHPLPSHFRHRKVSCQGFYLQNLTKVPEKYSYLVPTVQHRYTNSIAMLHYQYSYAALPVQGCCTFTGTIIRKSLRPFFVSLTGNIKGELKAHSSFYYSKTYP